MSETALSYDVNNDAIWSKLEQLMVAGSESSDVKAALYAALFADKADIVTNIDVEAITPAFKVLKDSLNGRSFTAKKNGVFEPADESSPKLRHLRAGFTYEILDGISCVHLFRLYVVRFLDFLEENVNLEVALEFDKTYRLIVQSDKWNKADDISGNMSLIAYNQAIPEDFMSLGTVNIGYDRFKEFALDDDAKRKEFIDRFRGIRGPIAKNQFFFDVFIAKRAFSYDKSYKEGFDPIYTEFLDHQVDELRYSTPFLELASVITGHSKEYDRLLQPYYRQVFKDDGVTLVTNYGDLSKTLLDDVFDNITLKYSYLLALINRGMFTSVESKPLHQGSVRSLELAVGSIGDAIHSKAWARTFKAKSYLFANSILFKSKKPTASNGLNDLRRVVVASLIESALFQVGVGAFSISQEKKEQIVRNKDHGYSLRDDYGVNKIDYEIIAKGINQSTNNMLAHLYANGNLCPSDWNVLFNQGTAKVISIKDNIIYSLNEFKYKNLDSPLIYIYRFHDDPSIARDGEKESIGLHIPYEDIPLEFQTFEATSIKR